MQLSNPDSVRLTFSQAGAGETREDGLLNRKTVSYTIVAQAVEGNYEVMPEGRASAKIETGEAFLSAPGVPLAITHHCAPQSGRMRMRWVHFSFSVFDAVSISSLVEFPLRMERPWAERIGRLSGKMLAIQRSNSAKSLRSTVKINALSFEILSTLLDFLSSKGLHPKLNPGMERLLPALEYARRRLAERIFVKDLARKVGLSTPRFHAEFKRLFGETPISHLRKIRLSKACDLLRDTDLVLEEIAAETGFCSQFHFSREFKRFYGEPPSTYRQTMRKGFVL